MPKLGQHMTDEQRAKDSAAHKGISTRPCSEETKMAISRANKGRSLTLETRAKISTGRMGTVPWNKGIPRTAEEKAKMSAANMGHVASAETRAKQSAKQMGIKATPEWRLHISLGLKGHVESPDTRAKISKACWKNGNTPITELIRSSAEYARWRTAVFERDNYTCQECGQHGSYLEAHHIHEFAKYLDERFVVDNGKTLCLKCHKKTQRKGVKVAA